MSSTQLEIPETALTRRQELKKALSKGARVTAYGVDALYSSSLVRACHYRAVIKVNETQLSRLGNTDWSACREILCESIASALTQQKHYDWNAVISKDIYEHYTSLMFEQVSFKNIKNGLRVLRYFEKRAGFDLTFIKHVRNGFVYVCGPKEWVQSVPYLSLYLMLVKVINKHPIKPKETVKKYLKRVISTEYENQKIEYYLDRLLLTHSDILIILLKHYKELQSSIDYSNWTGDVDDLGIEGINMLTKEASSNNNNPIGGWYGPHKDFVIVLSQLLKKYKGKKCLWK